MLFLKTSDNLDEGNSFAVICMYFLIAINVMLILTPIMLLKNTIGTAIGGFMFAAVASALIICGCAKLCNSEGRFEKMWRLFLYSLVRMSPIVSLLYLFLIAVITNAFQKAGLSKMLSVDLFVATMAVLCIGVSLIFAVYHRNLLVTNVNVQKPSTIQSNVEDKSAAEVMGEVNDIIDCNELGSTVAETGVSAIPSHNKQDDDSGRDLSEFQSSAIEGKSGIEFNNSGFDDMGGAQHPKSDVDDINLATGSADTYKIN